MITTTTTTTKLSRCQYGSLCGYTKPIEYATILRDLQNLPDEHGWPVEGGEWDRKSRGQQLTIDIYGADEQKNLFVVQVRQSIRRRASYYLQIRKSYFLIGRNENENAFAHCVSATAIRAAINHEGDVVNPLTAVNAALKWIWQTDRYMHVIRHGDVALLPVKSVPRHPATGAHVEMVIDSHQIWSPEIRRNGKLFARNPYLHHIKNQHPDVKCTGWCQVLVGRREPAWSFAPVTVD